MLPVAMGYRFVRFPQSVFMKSEDRNGTTEGTEDTEEEELVKTFCSPFWRILKCVKSVKFDEVFQDQSVRPYPLRSHYG